MKFVKANKSECFFFKKKKKKKKVYQFLRICFGLKNGVMGWRWCSCILVSCFEKCIHYVEYKFFYGCDVMLLLLDQ